MSIQFTQSMQKAYIQHAEDVGLATINLLKDYAKVPRIEAIAGKSSASYMDGFTGDDLSLVNRTEIDIGNPLQRTIAGKVNLADALLGKGMIDNPDQYISVITTGNLKPVLEGPQSQNTLMKDENEKLSVGQPVTAMITDRHDLHILEHSVVSASVTARQNPEVMKAVVDHILEHMQLYQNMPPLLAQTLGMAPPPMMAPAPMPMPGEAPPPGGAAIPSGQPQEAQLPNMPTNPATGQEWNPIDGGGTTQV